MSPIPDPTGVEKLEQGERHLKDITKSYIDEIHFPPGLGEPKEKQPRLCDLIKRMIDDTFFATHNQFTMFVEQTCTWTATRGDGKRAFQLVVNFSEFGPFFNPSNADNPRAVVGTQDTSRSTRPPHYGYDITLDGKRIAGPGHVDFVENINLRNCRLGPNTGNLTDSTFTKQESYGTGTLEYESVIRKY
ncbi:hypothetical protein Daus18300_009873 [Diaporthe australafricana]|uniref:Uncharacterized protein n=1 Tax=Diaporthe australafricana TaxID=127596 RepID=A0ABR3WCC6_9PEZI